MVLDRGTCWFTSLLIARLKARAAKNDGDSSENDEGKDNGESSVKAEDAAVQPNPLGASLPGESGDDCELCEARAHDPVGGSQIELLSADVNDHVHEEALTVISISQEADSEAVDGSPKTVKDAFPPVESISEFTVNVDGNQAEKVAEDKTLRYQIVVLTLLGDAIGCGLFDGVAIAAAFASSLPLGVSTAIAVVLHEIPLEISDIAIMYSSGLPTLAIAGLNVLVSFSALIGVLIFLILQALSDQIVMWLLPFIAGSFVYMAASVCVPLLRELNSQTDGNSCVGAVMQAIGYMLGAGVMLTIAILE